MFEESRVPASAAAAASDGVPTNSPGAPEASPARERFRSCRWSAVGDPATPDHCTHRDVLPLAGATGFNPEAWCPTCSLYKLRRAPKRRERPSYDY